MFKKKEYRYILKLDKYEYGIVLNALNKYRKVLESENKDSEPVARLILRIIE